jgi:ABC-type transporter Mla subunit MlaD
MNDRVMQFRVGVVVLATAIITGILIVLFGDLPSLVQSTYPLRMSFADARGVADGHRCARTASSWAGCRA